MSRDFRSSTSSSPTGRRSRAFAGAVTVAAIAALGAGAFDVGVDAAGPKPELNTLVTSRARVFSAGLDPFLEAMAAGWFENLGFLVLESTTSAGTGVWGGAKFSSDSTLATSYCLDSDVNTGTVNDYDVVSWLPTPSVVEDLLEDYPDAKVVVFESIATEWYKHAESQAQSAAKLGDECGCASEETRSSSSACGDETYHYCDIYPCMYTRLFGSEVPDEETWKSAYIDRVREIKAAIPTASLLVVPMTLTQSHARAVAVSKALAEFLSITDDVDAFGETYPFMTRNLTGTTLNNGSRFWIALITILATWVVFFYDRKSPLRKFFRRLMR